MVHEYKTTRRVEFADTDMAGIAHFSNFFRYMEATEHEFFRTHGLSLHGGEPADMHGWVRVKASCDYRLPARYQDLLEITLRVAEKSTRKLRYAFTFRVVDEPDGNEAPSDELHSAETPSARSPRDARPPTTGPPIAQGELVVVHVVRRPGDDQMRSAEMPPEVAQLIEVAPQSTAPQP